MSDAGTPLFSDPGYVVVSRASGGRVRRQPGAGCVVGARSAQRIGARDRSLHVRGLPAQAIGGSRQAEIRRLSERGDAFVVHEAPRRVGGLLADLAAVVPEWELCIGREVTKVFEEFRRGAARASRTSSPTTTRRAVSSRSSSRRRPGRTTPHARSMPAPTSNSIGSCARCCTEGVTPKTMAKALGELPGMSHKEAYARVLGIADRR